MTTSLIAGAVLGFLINVIQYVSANAASIGVASRIAAGVRARVGTDDSRVEVKEPTG